MIPNYKVVAYPKKSNVYDADSFRKSLSVDMGFGIVYHPKGHRLFGCDAAEKNPKKKCHVGPDCDGCGGTRSNGSIKKEKAASKIAKEWLIEVVQESHHFLLYPRGPARGLDKYGRILAEWVAVMEDGTEIHIANELIKRGWAIPYGGEHGLTKPCAETRYPA